MASEPGNEAKVISSTEGPITGPRLRADFERLGLRPGSLVMIHSALSKVGWIPGGVQLFLETLIDYLGPEGTLMAPTHSGQLTDPARWQAPPVPEAWHEEIRKGFPAYDPAKTPTRSMGIVPETLRRWPGAIRSAHPHTSFCAVGPMAEKLMADHPLSSPMGKQSPLQKLVDANGETLLMGAGFANNTCFHLAEDYIETSPRFIDGAPIKVDGKMVWTQFDAIDYDDTGFADCGAAFVDTGAVTQGKIGQADCSFFRTQSAVEFAIGWLRQNR